MSIRDFQSEIIRSLFSNSNVNFQTNEAFPQVNITDMHFPVRLEGREKRCKVCYKDKGESCSRSCYKCGACSSLYNVDVVLCIECFSDFHLDPSKFIKKKNQ